MPIEPQKVDKAKKDKFKEIGNEFIVDDVDTRLADIGEDLKNDRVKIGIEKFEGLIRDIQRVQEAMRVLDQE